jgi:sugar transferase (PEP-CTERM/EpsH1 system associated)
MRIDMALPSMPAAGMENVVARLTRALAARGHDVAIVCVEEIGALGEVLRAEGVPVLLAPSPGLATNLRPRALIETFTKRRPDVVHSHSGAWLKVARAARMSGIPRVIHTVHGLLDREPVYGPFLMRRAAARTDVVAPVSRPLLEHLRDHVRIPAKKLHLMANGIDTSVFRPNGDIGPLRSRFDLGPERVIIGHVARFAAVKNQAMLVDAFARLHARRPEAFLAFVGDGELRGTIEQRVADLGIADHVGFYGLASDLPPLYRAFDVFVLSSFAEGTSMSILEAMATGLPVVATDVGGNRDLLGDAGMLVSTDDADAMAAGLERVVASDAARAEHGKRSRTRAEASYDHGRMVEAYEALYRPGGR